MKTRVNFVINWVKVLVPLVIIWLGSLTYVVALIVQNSRTTHYRLQYQLDMQSADIYGLKMAAIK